MIGVGQEETKKDPEKLIVNDQIGREARIFLNQKSLCPERQEMKAKEVLNKDIAREDLFN